MLTGVTDREGLVTRDEGRDEGRDRGRSGARGNLLGPTGTKVGRNSEACGLKSEPPGVLIVVSYDAGIRMLEGAVSLGCLKDEVIIGSPRKARSCCVRPSRFVSTYCAVSYERDSSTGEKSSWQVL